MEGTDLREVAATLFSLRVWLALCQTERKAGTKSKIEVDTEICDKAFEEWYGAQNLEARDPVRAAPRAPPRLPALLRRSPGRPPLAPPRLWPRPSRRALGAAGGKAAAVRLAPQVSYAALQGLFREQQLTSATYVFTEGMNAWTVASELELDRFSANA